jgi:hypothetical protein
MTLNNTNILIRHNYVAIPAASGTASDESLATIAMNLAYYGYALSVESYKALTKVEDSDLHSWWKDLEKELKLITGESRKIAKFVVYKNFPKEVLDKTLAEYWLPQILMYWGFPNEFFTQLPEKREKMDEAKKAIVLKKAKKDSLKDIFTSYLKAAARWKSEELSDVLFLAEQFPINLSKLTFKENLVKLATYMMENNLKINITTATDALRLAVGLSGGNVSLREKAKFISFKKPVRRFILSTLEGCGNLAEDAARRPELFKRLMHQLHPFDYKKQFPSVCKVADDLYHDRLETFNSRVEGLLAKNDPKVLEVLAERPGDFRRRLVHTLNLFGNKAVKAFVAPEVLDKLTTAQVVTLRSYIETVNDRLQRVFPPKGNWNRVQLGEARWIEESQAKAISKALGKVLKERVPKVKVLDEATSMIKLPSNDGEVSPYARGTVFPIPDDVEFIRTASYWKIQSFGYVWFDNGWNFFDKDWKEMGACCWSAVKYPAETWGSRKSAPENVGAVFSGDPTNTKDMQGRAAQLIDLYPKGLVKKGVRYAVWNILCYSHIPFSKAEDVFAALQWGKDPQKGKLFEPSRCQLSFPLSGDSMTKYIVLIDLEKREMIYLDANLKGNVRSAASNGAILEEKMPAFMEYINSLPSVHDLFRESVDKDAETQILYSDKDAELKNVSAYVFRPENQNNKYKSIDINSILT